MREGVAPISAKGFYDHFTNGQHGQRMYDDVNFIRGVEIVSEIDKLIAENDDHISRYPGATVCLVDETAAVLVRHSLVVASSHHVEHNSFSDLTSSLST